MEIHAAEQVDQIPEYGQFNEYITVGPVADGVLDIIKEHFHALFSAAVAAIGGVELVAVAVVGNGVGIPGQGKQACFLVERVHIQQHHGVSPVAANVRAAQQNGRNAGPPVTDGSVRPGRHQKHIDQQNHRDDEHHGNEQFFQTAALPPAFFGFFRGRRGRYRSLPGGIGGDIDGFVQILLLTSGLPFPFVAEIGVVGVDRGRGLFRPGHGPGGRGLLRLLGLIETPAVAVGGVAVYSGVIDPHGFFKFRRKIISGILVFPFLQQFIRPV